MAGLPEKVNGQLHLEIYVAIDNEWMLKGRVLQSLEMPHGNTHVPDHPSDSEP